jgi:hypothetical protein
MAFKKSFGGRLPVEIYVNVSSEGTFSTTLPEHVVCKLHSAGIKTNQHPKKGDGYFCADSMDGLLAEVKATLDKYSEKILVREEVVLQYAISVCCYYCKLEDGTIVPNGSYLGKEPKEGNVWVGGNIDSNAFGRNKPFSFEVYVYPRFKSTWRFHDGSEKSSYDSVPQNLVVKGSALEYLLAIPPMSADLNGGTVKEIEYTEDIAQFFKNALLYVCKMNESFKAAFGEDIDLSKFKDLALPDFSGAKIEAKGGKKGV